MADNVFDMLIVPQDVMHTCAKRARELRIRQNITQKELAERVGVAEGTIKRLNIPARFSSARCSASRWCWGGWTISPMCSRYRTCPNRFIIPSRNRSIPGRERGRNETHD